jgi:competence protein ComEA
MPTRTGRPDAVEIATRLSQLSLPSAARPPSTPPALSPRDAPVTGGWLPVQARPAEPPPAAPAPPAPPALSSLARAWVEDRLPLGSHRLIRRVNRGMVLTVAALVVVALLGLVVVMHHRSVGSPAYAGASWPGSSSPDPSVAAASTSSATSSGATSSAATSSDSIVVDVGGRVRRPGLVTLPPGSRVADAIAAAGGALRHRDVATTDLAAKVGDGQLLLIGSSSAGTGAAAGVPAGGSADASSSAAPVSLSSADLTTLETLPGVGPVTAQKIIDWRTAHNGFTSIEQLQQVPGIGPSHYAEVAALVTP